jgi:hypothetical protein
MGMALLAWLKALTSMRFSTSEELLSEPTQRALVLHSLESLYFCTICAIRYYLRHSGIVIVS